MVSLCTPQIPPSLVVYNFWFLNLVLFQLTLRTPVLITTISYIHRPFVVYLSNSVVFVHQGFIVGKGF